MRFVNIWWILVVLLSLICLCEPRPFFFANVGQAIGGVFHGVYKFFDNTPTLAAQNRTSMKRAPAFASKYSISQSVDRRLPDD